MTHRIIFFLIISFVISYFPKAVVAQTVIFNSSISAQPGKAVSLQGNFSASTKVYLTQGTSTSPVPLPVLVQSANQATVQIPANLALDLYQVWVEDQGNSSPKVFVNKADGMHFDSPDVSPGGSLRIFGRNLELDGSTPRVRFYDGTTYLEGEVNTSRSDAYTLSVKAPNNLKSGWTYSVWVSNGYGGTVGETKMEQKITAIKPGSDYFKLGVGWATKFDFYRNIYNVKTDPRLSEKAVGDGNANDYNAIRKAIKQANADGGGIVYLPAGTYKLVYDDNFEGIRMLSRVVVQGAGKDLTTVTFGYNTDDSKVGVYWPSDTYQAGLADLSLLNVDNSGKLVNNMRGIGNEAFLQRIRFDLSVSAPFGWANSNKIVIANSEFTQGVNAQYDYRGPLVLNACTNFVVSNNTFTYAVHGLDLNRVREGVFENNRVYRDGSARYPTQDKNGPVNHVLILNFAENIAILNNLIKVINGPAQDDDDGEAIMAEGGGASETRYDEDTGVVSSATATTLRDNSKNWGALERMPVVAIVNGRGMGQWRTIVSHKGTTMNLDRPWDVVPASGSRYAIFNWGSRKWLVKGNTMEGNSRGITLYKNATTQVAIISNTLTNSGSIDLTPVQQLRGTIQTFIPMYNNQIVGNSVSNTDRSNGAFIGIHPVQHAQTQTFGTSAIGLEVRNNNVTAGSPNVPATIHGPYPEGFLNYLEYHSPGKNYLDEQIPAIVGSILENNTAVNCDNALYLNTGSYNTFICDLRLTNTPNALKESWFNAINHASVRTVSCTPIVSKAVAKAGPDQTLTLPKNTVLLDGTASSMVTSSPNTNNVEFNSITKSNSFNNINNYSWTQQDGPNRATLSDTTRITLTVRDMVAGTYVFRLTVTDAQGINAFDEVTVTVNPEPTAVQSVVSYSLINADTDQPIKTLVAGEQLNLATLPTRNLNIRVNTNPETVGSVVINLSGQQTRTQTETGAPYALFGDVNGDYKNWTPTQGNYTLKATPYTGEKGKGTAGISCSLNFTVINKAPGARLAAEENPEVEDIQVKYYPNPFSQSFTLQVQNRGQDKLPVVVYDIYGRVVIQLEDAQPEQLISLSNEYTPGMYFLQVGTGYTAKSYKLMKTQ